MPNHYIDPSIFTAGVNEPYAPPRALGPTPLSDAELEAFGTAQGMPPTPAAPITAQDLRTQWYSDYMQERRQQKEARKLMAKYSPEMKGIDTGKAVAAGIGVAGTVAQVGLAMRKTSTEKNNIAKIAELERLFETGAQGLTPQEYNKYASELQTRIARMQRDQSREREAAQASTGPRTAQDLATVQREERRALMDAGQEGGQFLVEKDIEAAAAQAQEYEERMAYQGAKEEGRTQFLIGAAGEVAKPLGELASGIPQKTVDSKTMAAMVERYGPEQAMLMANMMKSLPKDQRAALISEAAGQQRHA